MTDQQDLSELLQQALDAVNEAGGTEKHRLLQVIGKPAFDRMMSKPKTADLIDRWLDASSKAKPAATRALSLAIARTADRADLVSRIENEIGDAFELPRAEARATEKDPRRSFSLGQKRAPITTQVVKHRAAVNQRRNGQRSDYAPPKGVDLAMLAKGNDVGRYIKARRNNART